jgi:hypothetical protein
VRPRKSMTLDDGALAMMLNTISCPSVIQQDQS